MDTTPTFEAMGQLDPRLAADHAAQTSWDVVCRLDLSPFYDAIVAREGGVDDDDGVGGSQVPSAR